MAKKIYLKVKSFRGCDDYYFKIGNDESWKDILQSIENVLEDRFVQNDDILKGIKIDCELVTLTKEEYDEIEWENK